ncbi:MAG: Coenzyme F420 hydrogenase/dehydrogenase, beta subunit C-terminal domain [Chitinispirillales bacterium]|jgi:coenzyme F420-reducing hydrogenase beta subunit|nr:Coenzyme F420 hydrogenase/dehydrogenase, beta subunit C-terminal domain [Chitinispirillales bacterium]
MTIIENTNLCNGCHACYSICPDDAIAMKENSEGFLFPNINCGKCDECGLCKKTCPMNKTQIERTGESKLPRTFAVTHKNEEILLNSSSGGAFTLFAEQVINEGGVVFGARFNENWEIIHDYAETLEGLAAFRRSKYIQSRIGDVYKQVKNFLTETNRNRKVLFVGSPCQIGGLKSYLQKDYENLICADFICAKMPSPKVWRKYIEYHEKKQGSKITRIAQRVKKNHRWAPFYVLISFADGRQRYILNNFDLFKGSWHDNLFLRKSCHNCGFKTANRNSDITFADFWGIQDIAPEAYDSRGTSLVSVHSSEGQKFFDLVKYGAKFLEVNSEETFRHHRRRNALFSQTMSERRTAFMEDIDRLPFDKLIKKYVKISFIRKVYRNVKVVLFGIR